MRYSGALQEGWVPRVSETTFTKTQHRVLEGFFGGPREREANNTTNLALERKGLIRRLEGPRPSRRASHAVILWEITEAGRAKLQHPR